MHLDIRPVENIDEFYSLREQWENLLNKSNANRLFLSWQWQYSWWLTWGIKLDLKLRILLAYKGSDLVGLAPLYLDHINYKGFFKINRIQFIGNSWDKVSTVRTEYLEFISYKDMSDLVCKEFVRYIHTLDDWDEIVLCDVPKTSTTFNVVMGLKTIYRWYIPELKSDFGVKINTTGCFKQYLSLIGSNTRLKLYNRREYLQSLKDFKIESNNHDVLDYFSILNAFHKERWGKICFAKSALDFHVRLIGLLNEKQNYEISCICVGADQISILYNLSFGGVIYNIQSGYIENFDKKLSLGTIHFGYAIEQAFNDKAIVAFDMLIGSGKNEFYKKKYKGDIIEFKTLRVVRTRSLKIFLIFYYFSPERIRKIIWQILDYLSRIGKLINNKKC